MSFVVGADTLGIRIMVCNCLRIPGVEYSLIGRVNHPCTSIRKWDFEPIPILKLDPSIT